MDSIPPELIDRISSFLERDDLKRTLFVSRHFQIAAERYSGAFNNFTFKSTELKPWPPLKLFQKKKNDDENSFLKTYSGRRFRYLRYVELHTSFPALKCSETDPYDLRCRESRDDISKKDKVFTEQIRRIFQIIKLAEDHAGHAQGSGKIELVILTPIQQVDEVFCRHRVSSAWRVHLLGPQDLPELTSVRSLSICNPDEDYPSNYRPFRSGYFYARSRLDWRVLVEIASRLPNLEYLGCQLGVEEERITDVNPAQQHFEFDYEACARDSRHGLANALDSTSLPSTLRYVQLDFLYQLGTQMNEQRGGGPNFLIKLASHDILSNSLRKFASNLRRLDLRLMADETLFWSAQGSVSWPNLEYLSVRFHICTPSGSWYFRGASGEGGDDEGYDVTNDMYPPLEDGSAQDAPWHKEENLYRSNLHVDSFRIVPNEETLQPFLAAFAKAATKMYALKAASLWAALDGLAWGIAYAKPGSPATLYGPPGEENLPIRQLWWRVGPWRPNASLHKLFQEIGSQHGEGLVEHWNVESCGDVLVGEEDFEKSIAAFPRYTGIYPKLSLMKG